MAVKDDSTLITKGDLKKFYNKILPYMGGNYVFNTLGTKDYYSEDEKVIGVWTDGKPLYRKTVTGNITSKDQSLFTVNENVDVMVSIQGYTHTGVYYFPFNFTQDGSTQRCVFYKKDIDSIEFRGNEFVSGETFTVILEYTKTTDAANSAVGTIGCYDITRPDLWPENKEITFGNGLYGQRFVGTYTPIACSKSTSIEPNGVVDKVLLSGVAYTQSIGGYAKGYNSNTIFAISTPNNQNKNGVFIYVTSLGELTLMSVCWSELKSSNITDKEYDIWVTYKKK